LSTMPRLAGQAVRTNRYGRGMSESPVPTTASLGFSAALAFLGVAFLVEALVSSDGSWITIVVGAVVAVVYGSRTIRSLRLRRRARLDESAADDR
jgi:hypothetical protein